MNTVKKRELWRVWVDTGGTFTDCLARDPAGRLHRAKVLSSSALRGEVDEVLDARRLRCSLGRELPPEFLTGFEFNPEGPAENVCRIESYDAESGIVSLSEALGRTVSKRGRFEALAPYEAPILAARLATETPGNESLPPMEMRLGTTRGTNALLERRGAPTALFITRGFGDLLEIGTQQRPDLFALKIVKPRPLYDATVEVNERLDADGRVIGELDLSGAIEAAKNLARSGIRSAAVTLMHSYLNPGHEHRLAQGLFQAGFEFVACSADLAPFIQILPRAQTAVVDAYIGPVIEDYLRGVGRDIDGPLHVMTSAGGLARADVFRAKDSLLSGPAGGVAGAAAAGRRSGFERLIGFDMGGTSTDVSRYDGDFEYVFEHVVGDARLLAPALAIETVAAGGGSVCSFDGDALVVGPESAGASPGPACYGAGGPLTLTDVNLLLGRLHPRRFGIPLAPQMAEGRFAELHREVESARGEKAHREQMLEGWLAIANERMAEAIRRISVRKGYDPSDHALVAFGGAGGQHACAVARLLNIETAIIPPDAGLLSALGIGGAVFERFREHQVLRTLGKEEAWLVELLENLADEARVAVTEEGVARENTSIRRRIVRMRYAGQNSTIDVEPDPRRTFSETFADRYQQIFGYVPEGRPVEVESVRVVASSIPEPFLPPQRPGDEHEPEAADTLQSCFDGRLHATPAFNREELLPGARIAGPAIVFEAHCTTVVEPGWLLEMDGAGALVLRVENGSEEEA